MDFKPRSMAEGEWKRTSLQRRSDVGSWEVGEEASNSPRRADEKKAVVQAVQTT